MKGRIGGVKDHRDLRSQEMIHTDFQKRLRIGP